MEYVIIHADSAAELTNFVNEALQRGWKLQGGVSCSLAIEHTSVDHDYRGREPAHAVGTVFHEVWAQAMTREG